MLSQYQYPNPKWNYVVVVGLRPKLPVKGVDIILGNDLAGDRVWAEAPPPSVVTHVPEPLPAVAQAVKTELDPGLSCFQFVQ